VLCHQGKKRNVVALGSWCKIFGRIRVCPVELGTTHLDFVSAQFVLIPRRHFSLAGDRHAVVGGVVPRIGMSLLCFQEFCGLLSYLVFA